MEKDNFDDFVDEPKVYVVMADPEASEHPLEAIIGVYVDKDVAWEDMENVEGSILSIDLNLEVENEKK